MALLLLVQPVMAQVYLCWWRLRVWQGRMYFVHPGGWYEALEHWALDCLDILFEEEPEMAAYIVGMEQLPVCPPSQRWLQCCQPLDAVGMAWIYEQVNFPVPASDGSSDGSKGRGSASDGSKGKGRGSASDGSKGKGRGSASDGSKGKGRGKASDVSTDASSSNDAPYICSWERRGHLGPNPVAPPNSEARGYASTMRRLQRRQLQRQGQAAPEHLQPRKVEISKSLKRQMWELQQRARKMACGDLTEEELAEEEEANKEWIAMNKEEEEMERQKKKKD